ncbi:hypothetical protein ACD588_15670 [Xanthomonas campestris pv. campestris]|uniref:hypothetical protein n=1 Tax=Xanthomonas campestris TaxID=339 RepID=UPI002379AE0C|nr:hypothetical protein [Xanthomonas campestris]MDM7713437.1 hypothetical protein [Xanthomonas campestris pv. campestris]MEB2026095.1 hypothetical protein [Xanthomonas campestris pv. campestris]WDJ77838.1 hypothetical protein JH282_05120 [Xanthomonas campestris pv. campestris]
MGDAVFAIFRRVKADNGDGNPLIYALKGRGGFSISRREVFKFIPDMSNSITNLVPHLTVDAIMAVPSSHGIANIVARRISKATGLPLLPCGFLKKKNSLVVSELIYRQKNVPLRKREQVAIGEIISLLQKNPGQDFSMKDVKVRDRAHVEPIQWNTTIPFPSGSLLLVDDLLATGQSLAVMSRLLLQLGTPQVQRVCLLGSLDRYVKI